ncbi:MAG: hypothetical protein QOJ94_1504 [Sphingomonadales bacterium]|jgi:hypothetical protein|nr:hypothetical protein [Sphingomonadales bacterium]
MNGETVADIMPGVPDATGSMILSVYSKVRQTFAVYRTRERVSIQFADDPSLGAQQRKAVSPLNPLRGQINGLIDGWRAAEDDDYVPRGSPLFFWRALNSHEVKAKAAMFDRRVADTLAMALQGDVDGAAALLAEIKANLLEERTSAARIDYLAFAALTTLALVLIAAGVTVFRRPMGDDERQLWLAFGAGSLGALFSTAIAMRSRAIMTDLQLRENRTDAIARIGIGAVAGVLLVVMVTSKIVSVDIGGGAISAAQWAVIAFIAFIGGFSERLVPDLLDKAAARATQASDGNPLAGTVASARIGNSGAGENNPLGAAATPPAVGAETGAAPAPDEDVDGCVSDLPLEENETTDDSQLPAAEGGVEQARPS